MITNDDPRRRAYLAVAELQPGHEVTAHVHRIEGGLSIGYLCCSNGTTWRFTSSRGTRTLNIPKRAETRTIDVHSVFPRHIGRVVVGEFKVVPVPP